jgi:hypothetical protein
LLVQGELQRAWKRMGFSAEPEIPCSELTPDVSSFPSRAIRFASAGGAKHRGMELRGGFYLEGIALSQEQVARNYGTGPPATRLRLREFINAPVIVVRDVWIPRRVVVKFIANKLGGAHFDPKRGTSDEDVMFKALDTTTGIQLLEKPAVYFELLSIGQALSSSRDIQVMLERTE